MPDIKVRVGQQNAVRVVSSISGSSGGFAVTSENVIGGIASVTSLSVSGSSIFNGPSIFNDYIDIQSENIFAENSQLFIRDITVGTIVASNITAENITLLEIDGGSY